MSKSKVKIKEEQEDGMLPNPNTLCKVNLHFVGSLTLDLFMCLGEIDNMLSPDSDLFQQIFYDSANNRYIKLNYANLAYYIVESGNGEPLFIHKKRVKNEEK